MRGRTNAMSGTVLPELSNPAGAANIQSGYQAINGEGEIVTGTAIVRSRIDVAITNNTNYVLQLGITTGNSPSAKITIAEQQKVTHRSLTNAIFYIAPVTDRDIEVTVSGTATRLLTYPNISVIGARDTPLEITVTS